MSLKPAAAVAGALGLWLSLQPLRAQDAVYQIVPNAEVDGRGVLASNVVQGLDVVAGSVKIALAPGAYQSATLTREQIEEGLRAAGQAFVVTNLQGAAQVRVVRRLRNFEEMELLQMLAEVLQREVVKTRGELELRLGRPWATIRVPDEAFVLKLQEVPANGLNPSMLVRFELRSDRESFGSWQVTVNSRVLRDVWVTRTPVARGTLVRDADLVMEKRDILTVREPLAQIAGLTDVSEFGEYLNAGQMVYARAMRLRPVVFRGQAVDALAQSGTLSMTLRVEVLEDGIPGQSVRVRNLQSRREFKAKVQNEQTVLVAF